MAQIPFTPTPGSSQRRRTTLAIALALSALAGGCAIGALEPGASLEATRQRLGRPAVEFATPEGGRRLMYGMGL